MQTAEGVGVGGEHYFSDEVLENREVVGAAAIGGFGGGFDGTREETEVEGVAGVALDGDDVCEAGEEHENAEREEPHQNIAQQNVGEKFECGSLHGSMTAPTMANRRR